MESDGSVNGRQRLIYKYSVVVLYGVARTGITGIRFMEGSLVVGALRDLTCTRDRHEQTLEPLAGQDAGLGAGCCGWCSAQRTWPRALHLGREGKRRNGPSLDAEHPAMRNRRQAQQRPRPTATLEGKGATSGEQSVVPATTGEGLVLSNLAGARLVLDAALTLVGQGEMQHIKAALARPVALAAHDVIREPARACLGITGTVLGWAGHAGPASSSR